MKNLAQDWLRERSQVFERAYNEILRLRLRMTNKGIGLFCVFATWRENVFGPDLVLAF